jgi:hypothetical protein
MARTLKVISDREKDRKVHPKMGELIDARFADLSNPPSLAALKLHEILFKAAGAAVAEDRWHQVYLSEIRSVPGMRKHDRQGLIRLFRELRGVVMEYDTDTATVIAGLLDVAKVEFEDGDGKALVRWTFGAGFREIAAGSDYYAIIDRQTALSMSSRYALRLYEILALRANLDHKSSDVFSIDDLRGRLGVPTGKLTTWNNLHQFAIKPAVAEINQLSRFTVKATAHKNGRSVVSVEFAWKVKPDLADTKRELGAHSAGRMARRRGTVESLSEAKKAPGGASPAVSGGFPDAGSVHFSKWGDLVREHAPKPTPDVDRVAEAFRRWARDRDMSLDARLIEKTFVGFVKGFRA